MSYAILARDLDPFDPVLLLPRDTLLGLGAMANWGHGRDDNRRRDRDHWGNGGGGRSSYGGGGNQAHNPYEIKLPRFLSSVAECEDSPKESSMIMIDSRDERMVSPFQAWLVGEIMSNAASSINVLTERDQVMPPSSGFHLSLFGNYTLDGIKAVLAVSIDSVNGAQCAGWNSATATALSHPAFAPFTWPMLRDTSASYTDIKIYNGNEILFHWIMRGYRSDTDLTVQQSFVDEFLIREVNKGRPRLSVVIAAFIGWRVSVMSYECGGRIYSVGPHGAVVATDHARARFELRVCSRSSDDAVGNDADRVEFRFRDANNRIDLKCARTSVPGTWLTVSHISGPTLIRTIQAVRDSKARVEGPEQTEQFAQLAAVHKLWWEDSVAQDSTQVGSLVTFVGNLQQGNFHVITCAKLRESEPEIVPMVALAEMQHDVGHAAPVGPPSITDEAWARAAAGQEKGGEDDRLTIVDRTSYELTQRSLGPKVSHAQVGQMGHVVDEDRDQSRMDRRFARSTASLTPQLFAQHMSSQYNKSTVQVEELGGESHRPSRDDRQPQKVPASTPSQAMEAGRDRSEAPATPRGAPVSLAPAVPAAQEKQSDPAAPKNDQSSGQNVESWSCIGMIMRLLPGDPVFLRRGRTPVRIPM